MFLAICLFVFFGIPPLIIAAFDLLLQLFDRRGIDFVFMLVAIAWSFLIGMIVFGGGTHG